jgi:hypothetical protein
MFRYTEAQLYKIFMDAIPIFSRGYSYSRLMNDAKFYTRFSAIYVFKLNKDRIRRDNNFSCYSLIKTKKII